MKDETFEKKKRQSLIITTKRSNEKISYSILSRREESSKRRSKLGAWRIRLSNLCRLLGQWKARSDERAFTVQLLYQVYAKSGESSYIHSETFSSSPSSFFLPRVIQDSRVATLAHESTTTNRLPSGNSVSVFRREFWPRWKICSCENRNFHRIFNEFLIEIKKEKKDFYGLLNLIIRYIKCWSC